MAMALGGVTGLSIWHRLLHLLVWVIGADTNCGAQTTAIRYSRNSGIPMSSRLAIRPLRRSSASTAGVVAESAVTVRREDRSLQTGGDGLGPITAAAAILTSPTAPCTPSRTEPLVTKALEFDCAGDDRSYPDVPITDPAALMAIADLFGRVVDWPSPAEVAPRRRSARAQTLAAAHSVPQRNSQHGPPGGGASELHQESPGQPGGGPAEFATSIETGGRSTTSVSTWA